MQQNICCYFQNDEEYVALLNKYNLNSTKPSIIFTMFSSSFAFTNQATKSSKAFQVYTTLPLFQNNAGSYAYKVLNVTTKSSIVVFTLLYSFDSIIQKSERRQTMSLQILYCILQYKTKCGVRKITESSVQWNNNKMKQQK